MMRAGCPIRTIRRPALNSFSTILSTAMLLGADARMRCPLAAACRMISISTVEWPSQVTRSPLSGVLPQAARGSLDGKGPRGTRRSPPLAAWH